MKASPKKSSATTSTTATQAANEPFFSKAYGGSFFAPAKGTAAPAVQTKMTVNEPGDKYEQEADMMAEKVVRMPIPASMPIEEEKLQQQPEDKLQEQEEDKIQKVALPEEKLQKQEGDEEIQTKLQRMNEEEVQTKLQCKPDERLQAKGTPDLSDEAEQKIQSMRGQGEPLPSEVQHEMENKMGADFSAAKRGHILLLMQKGVISFY